MKILKIGTALGSQKRLIKDITKKNYQKVIKTTGISKVFHVTDEEDIINLATKASKKVLKSEKNIDAIILITQTPKYNIPSNSFIIQKNLLRNLVVKIQMYLFRTLFYYLLIKIVCLYINFCLYSLFR